MADYIPILTTLFSIFFFVKIFNHYRQKQKAVYLLWWTIGVFTYGLGTLTESINILFGWSEINTKIWYVVGALLGGFPLAQGTVHLLLPKKPANVLSILFILLITVAAFCVFITPVLLPDNFDGQLTGKVFEWQWVRKFSPFINIYAFLFLVGGAVFSAYKYRKEGRENSRFLGNIFIALGGLLPGIGGTFTRYGYVEVLFVTELLGLILIYVGYYSMRYDKVISIHSNQTEVGAG